MVLLFTKFYNYFFCILKTVKKLAYSQRRFRHVYPLKSFALVSFNNTVQCTSGYADSYPYSYPAYTRPGLIIDFTILPRLDPAGFWGPTKHRIGPCTLSFIFLLVCLWLMSSIAVHVHIFPELLQTILGSKSWPGPQ